QFKNKRNIVRFVEGIIRNWYDNKITNMDELDEYLEKTDSRHLKYNRIFKALGFHFRLPTEAEKQAMNTWLEEWNFPMEVILKACENSKKTANPNIHYIDSILHKWHEEGIRTLQDLEKKESIVQSAAAKTENKAPKNRFHNFEQQASKYSKEELEKLFRQNK
ncbi:MAG TPA: DnaD domain protein, partial [Clostridiales bacterium]|nr:DnaD domain protein [Clostridiales bacterium]